MKKYICRDKCPICDSPLIEYGVSEVFGTCYAWNKTTYSKCKRSELIIREGCYQLESHFKVEARDGVSYHETFVFYPFIVASYSDVSNIYIYGKSKDHKHFVAETPYLDLPWKNKEKVINKLKLYTVFS